MLQPWKQEMDDRFWSSYLFSFTPNTDFGSCVFGTDAQTSTNSAKKFARPLTFAVSNVLAWSNRCLVNFGSADLCLKLFTRTHRGFGTSMRSVFFEWKSEFFFCYSFPSRAVPALLSLLALPLCFYRRKAFLR